MNGLKVLVAIIPQKSILEKSCASHTKEEVSEFIARTDKGIGIVKLKNDLPSHKDNQRRRFDDRKLEFSWPAIDTKEPAPWPRVWDLVWGAE